MRGKNQFFIYPVSFIMLLCMVNCETEEIKNEPEVEDTLKVATLNTLDVSNVTHNSAIGGGQITDNGGGNITARGTVWSTSHNPTTENNLGITNDGTGDGYFTSYIEGLSSETTYYARAYAINSKGTSYGNEIEFTTEIPIPPAVNTTIIRDITDGTAIVGGNVTNQGASDITARGMVWSISPNPTILDNDGHVNVDGTIGPFTIKLENLLSHTIYHIRAYATNDNGTGYGEEKSFISANMNWKRDTITEVVDVINPTTGKIWMDRNLGASRAATSINDEEAYGDLYQWGREADGHQQRTSAASSGLSTSDTPGHSDFILVWEDDYNEVDWRSPSNDNLWQGVNGINNPCPVGYRLPTDAEYIDEGSTWIQDSVGAFESPLKLTPAGYRWTQNGTIKSEGSGFYYWSDSAWDLVIENYEVLDGAWADKSDGRSVRCIKD
ncbi:MAG: hypothetical protein ACOCYO_03410 [Bacteroidota bacterium]